MVRVLALAVVEPRDITILPLIMSAGSPFDARCERREDAVVVVVSGELDLDSAEKLRDLLRSPQARAGTVVLDLRQVTFIDSSGLSVVVGHHHRSQADQFRFAVAVGGAPAVERLLDLTGLRGTLTIVADPDAVLVG